MSFEYINSYYGVSAKPGQRVIAYGKPGVITGTEGQYVRIRLDGQKHSNPYHPTDGIEYLDGALVVGVDLAYGPDHCVKVFGKIGADGKLEITKIEEISTIAPAAAQERVKP